MTRRSMCSWRQQYTACFRAAPLFVAVWFVRVFKLKIGGLYTVSSMFLFWAPRSLHDINVVHSNLQMFMGHRLHDKHKCMVCYSVPFPIYWIGGYISKATTYSNIKEAMRNDLLDSSVHIEIHQWLKHWAWKGYTDRFIDVQERWGMQTWDNEKDMTPQMLTYCSFIFMIYWIAVYISKATTDWKWRKWTQKRLHGNVAFLQNCVPTRLL